MTISQFTGIKQADDTGMIDPGHRFNFLFEFLDSPLVTQTLSVEHLYHYVTRDLLIGGEVHIAKAALSQFSNDQVAVIQHGPDKTWAVGRFDFRRRRFTA